MRDYRMSWEFLIYLERFIGVPYRWGGDDPIDGFDCSGLVIEGLMAIGKVDSDFDTTAQGLYSMYKKVSKPDRGVLVFYGQDEHNITHVAACKDKLLAIESGGGGYHTRSKDDAARSNAVVRIRPIRRRNDIVGYCDPFN